MAKGFLGYRFYNFVKKDPVIDQLRTLVQDEGFTGKGALNQLSLLTGVSVSTFDNMFNGDTRMPRHTTVGATVNGLGYKEVFVRDRDKKIDRDRVIEKARIEVRKERQRKARKKANGGSRG